MNLQLIELQVIEIGILILAAYLGGMLARKLKIGEIIGQIAGGIVVGPHFLYLVKHLIENLNWLNNSALECNINNYFNSFYPVYSQFFFDARFFTFVYLGLVTFSLGEELHVQRIKQIGFKASSITIVQAVLTFVLIVWGFWIFLDYPPLLAMILGSIGIATAPALSFVIMNRLKIEGSLRNLLANVIVMDDLIEVVLFSLFLGIAVYMNKTGEVFHGMVLLQTLKELGITFFIGIAIFSVLWFLIRIRKDIAQTEQKTENPYLYAILSNHPTPSVEIMFIVTGVISIGIGVCMHYHLPFMLATVTAGFLIANYHSHAVFESLKIKNVMPIFNLFFFALIGAGIRIETINLQTLKYALFYIVLRTIGKYGGSWIACKIYNLDPKVTATLPKLMLPQAELAAIEVLLVANMLPSSVYVDNMVNTIVVSLLVFQLGGAWLSEKTLLRWKSWIIGEKEALESLQETDEILNFKSLLNNRVINIDALDPKTTVEFIADYLAKQGCVSEATEVTNAVLERELLLSTAIGKGIAIPHCRLSEITEPLVVCAVLNNPVDWNAPDKQPVDLVFLIVTPLDAPELYLNTIKTISITLRTTKFKDNIKTAIKHGTVKEYLKEL